MSCFIPWVCCCRVVADRDGRAYNDMLYLCEKYAPLEGLGRYDPLKDISVTGVIEAYDVLAGAKTT